MDFLGIVLIKLIHEFAYFLYLYFFQIQFLVYRQRNQQVQLKVWSLVQLLFILYTMFQKIHFVPFCGTGIAFITFNFSACINMVCRSQSKRGMFQTIKFGILNNCGHYYIVLLMHISSWWIKLIHDLIYYICLFFR